MLYGLYLSASGVMANSYRQDVIANNLANAETVGFKRDLAMFQERRTAFQERGGGGGNFSDPMQEHIGGGLLATPTLVDTHQGDLEPTGNPLDVAIQGRGYFTVANNGAKHLTRDGRFMVDNHGDLILTTESNTHVLDDGGNPIHLGIGGALNIDNKGVITRNGKAIAKLGVTDVLDPSKFSKQGGTMLAFPDGADRLAATGLVRAGMQERANVDPATELAALMDTQRQLEANANMIKYQDSMMQQLCNNVGKIS